MIAFIDHIAIAVEMPADLKIFQRFGYTIAFSEKNIPNLEIKRPFMKQFSAQQTLTLLKNQSCFDIEIIEYPKCGSSAGVSYYPVFENVDLTLFEERGEFSGVSGYKEVQLKDIKLPVLLNSNRRGNNFHFQNVFMSVENAEESALFWSYFGFKKRDDQSNTYKCVFTSAFNKGDFFLTLMEMPTGGKRFLDDAGISGLCFVSNFAPREREFLKSKQVHVTEIEKIKVNGKTLDVFFAIGPNDELVEVIGASR